MEWLVYLMKNCVYKECVRCKTQEEADIVIEQARQEDYEKYLLVVRDVKLNMPIQMEMDNFDYKTRNKER